jgi:hypothetical protein
MRKARHAPSSPEALIVPAILLSLRTAFAIGAVSHRAKKAGTTEAARSLNDAALSIS